MPGKTLLVLGSGPGIGVAVACAFSVRGFTHVALVSRDKARLGADQDRVLDAVQERGYSCQVKTWACDLTDFDALRLVLKEVEGFGTLECVLFNAARVAGKPPLEETRENIEQDFRLTNLALYETAKWAIPLLKKNQSERQFTDIDCDKHDSTLQGATARLGLLVNGQVRSACSGALTTRQVRL